MFSLFNAGAACVAAAVVALVVLRHRLKMIPAISVPEALHVLTHGELALRKCAALALSSVLFGEVTVLEELLDEVARKHPEYGYERDDELTLMDVALMDLMQGSKAAAQLLLVCTERDAGWTDDDEWNSLVRTAAATLAQSPGALKALNATARSHSSANASEAAALVQRITMTADIGKTATTNRAPVPDVLPFNTRVCCAECGKPLHKSKLRCQGCNNVGYCCSDHANKDAPRHAVWCVPRTDEQWPGGGQHSG